MRCSVCGEREVCHCGSYVDEHGYGDGHSPVSMGCQDCMERADREREALRTYCQEPEPPARLAQIAAGILRPLPPKPARGAQT